MERNKTISLRVNADLYKQMQRFLNTKHGCIFKTKKTTRGCIGVSFADFMEYQMLKTLEEYNYDYQSERDKLINDHYARIAEYDF